MVLGLLWVACFLHFQIRRSDMCLHLGFTKSLLTTGRFNVQAVATVAGCVHSCVCTPSQAADAELPADACQQLLEDRPINRTDV